MTSPPALDELTARLRAVNSRLRRRLREQGTIGDLTMSQVAALNRLESEGPMTVSRLARAEGLRPQSMGAIVSALDAAGLVAGASDPTDGRQTLYTLTPACIDRLAHGRTAHQDWLSDRLRHLEREEWRCLTVAIDLLERLCST